MPGSASSASPFLQGARSHVEHLRRAALVEKDGILHHVVPPCPQVVASFVCCYSVHVQKPNILAPLYQFALAVRDDDALWLDPVAGSEDPVPQGNRKSQWREIGTREIGGEVGRIYAFRVALRHRPGVHITIEVRLTVGSLRLTFSRLPDRRRGDWPPARRVLSRTPRASPSTATRAFNRKHWKRLRSLHRRFDAPPSAVLLVPDDAELRALVALRCVQQEYRADAAWEELRSYGLKSEVPKSVLDDVLQDVVDKFVSVRRPQALTKYVGLIKRSFLARDREAALARDAEAALAREEAALALEETALARDRKAHAHTAPRAHGGLLTVPEAARECGVPRRTVYQWIKRGVLSAAEKAPYRVAREEVERVHSEVPGTAYKAVMKLRDCGYDNARMWVRRRKGQGLSIPEIIKEAAESRRTEEKPEPPAEARPEPDVKWIVRQEREASFRRQARPESGNR